MNAAAPKLQKNTEVKFLHGFSVKQTTGFNLISWDQLVELCKSPSETVHKDMATAKANSQIIGAHDNAQSKRIADVVRHNNFTLLRVDLDDTDLEVNEIKSRLKAIDITSYILHTSARNKYIEADGTQHGNRYRLYIELKSGIDLETWSMLQMFLSNYFNSDTCANTPNQIMYLPSRFEKYCHRCIVNKGKAFDPKADTKMMKEAKELSAKFKEATKPLAVAEVIPTPRVESPRVGGQVSILEKFDSEIPWESLLKDAGHTPEHKADGTVRWLRPGGSEAAGIVVKSFTDGKERFFTYSTTDRGRLGMKTMISDNGVETVRPMSKLDFYAANYHGGDLKAALNDIGDKFFPIAQKHNRREWYIQKENQAVMALYGKELAE